jgi:hypothetical protein
MHSSKKENNIDLNDLISMAKEINIDILVNKGKLSRDIIKELKDRLILAHYATYDRNLQLDKLHRYLTNTRDYLQQHLETANNTQ